MTDRYRFDRFELAVAERQLTIAGEPAAIGARAFDLLLALVERRERVVAKSELLELVWPGLVVEENNLQVQVSALRKLLGAAVIATVAGRGYRLAAQLRAEATGAAEAKPSVPPTNLPQARTRFIGRTAALADCARLLASSRLITLSGIGGCGKTRLAQELARQQLDQFADGVWFVDLAPLQDGERVAAVVAATLGVPAPDGTPLATRLAEHVAMRRLLIVLDNCEHVSDAVVAVVEAMLAASPALHLVATSREAFGIAGEQIYPVRSLALPTSAELGSIRDSEAVRIFVDRARLVEPGFTLDAANAPVVAEICRRLDGIALAIELAAARVAVLSVDEIRTRLDDRFRLLTGGARALPRHQTLRATMHWSYEHLSAAEQELFRRLSVFAGGCTLAAVGHVTAADDEYAVLALLTALHDKSMLTVDREANAKPRYRMLETVRQYAQERLGESGEGDAIRGRHLRYCVALAEEIEPHYVDARQGEALALQRAEQENLLAAHGWCEHDPDGAALGLRLAAASWRYWRSSDQFERGRNVARAALAHAGPDAAPLPKCQLINGLATLAYYMGRYDESRELAEEGLALARRIGDLRQIAGALVLLTFYKTTGEDPPSMMARYGEIRRIAVTLGDGRLLARNLNNLAEWHRLRGMSADAAACYEESLALHRDRSHENPGMITVVLCNYARLLLGQGETARARTLLNEAYAITTTHGLRGMDRHVLEVGAALAALRAEPERTARLHGAALARIRDSGAKRESVDEAFLAPLLAGACAALGRAAFAAAERAGAALTREASLDDLGAWLADCRDDL
jgi:predicted ATPase/DNA-binding winged helix-turn-helix (wHTH) protein